MTEMQKFKVAQEAKIIVSGYAFVEMYYTWKEESDNGFYENP